MPTQTNLGRFERQSGWLARGYLAPDRCVLLALNLIDLVGMTPDGGPDIRFYPNAQGNGGQGVQVYQPLVESWLVIGTWPELGLVRVNLSSCKEYDPQAVQAHLEAQVGPVIKSYSEVL